MICLCPPLVDMRIGLRKRSDWSVFAYAEYLFDEKYLNEVITRGPNLRRLVSVSPGRLAAPFGLEFVLPLVSDPGPFGSYPDRGNAATDAALPGRGIGQSGVRSIGGRVGIPGYRTWPWTRLISVSRRPMRCMYRLQLGMYRMHHAD